MDHSSQSTYFQPFDVIVFPIIEWFFLFQRPQQLATGLARNGHRVFYLSTGFSTDEQPQCQPIRTDLPIFEVQLGGAIQKNLCTDQLDSASIQTLLGQISFLRETFQISKAVCMVNLPFWGPLVLKLQEEFGWKVVYDCLDHMGGFSLFTDFALEPEKELAEKSDLLLATSHLLFDENKGLNPNCLLVPNGTEFEHFNSAPENAVRELDALRKPVIGYYGAIDDWFDMDLVYRLAQARADWSFVLIGGTARSDLSKITSVRNVHLLGDKPYDRIPGYLRHFDVCIIPFKKIPLTDAMNPVKLFEYLSAGKSIVATDLNELQYYRKYVRLASTFDEWIVAMDLALQDYQPETVETRIRFASQNTWYERISVVEDALQGIYRQRMDGPAPWPLPFPRDTLRSSRLLARQGDVDYWSLVYGKDGLVYRQENTELTEREKRFLAKLPGKYFPRPLSIRTKGKYSVTTYKPSEEHSLLDSLPLLRSSAAALYGFIQHCLNILVALEEQGITLRNLSRETVAIRNGTPAVRSLEWAVTPREPFFTPDGLGGSERPLDGGFSDSYSMGKIIGYVNRHRFRSFDPVISVMTAEDSSMRITDLKVLKILFANAMNLAEQEPE